MRIAGCGARHETHCWGALHDGLVFSVGAAERERERATMDGMQAGAVYSVACTLSFAERESTRPVSVCEGGCMGRTGGIESSRRGRAICRLWRESVRGFECVGRVAFLLGFIGT